MYVETPGNTYVGRRRRSGRLLLLTGQRCRVGAIRQIAQLIQQRQEEHGLRIR